MSWLISREAARGQAAVPAEGSEGAVTLATVHAAKGLEWPLVVVPDLTHKLTGIPSEVLSGRGFRRTVQLDGSAHRRHGEIVGTYLRNR